MPKVVTANRLATGTVVFLGPYGDWVDQIGDAIVYDDMPGAEAGLADAKRDEGKAIVVDPFIVEQAPDEDGRPKMSLRDTIRAFGPTIAFAPIDGSLAR